MDNMNTDRNIASGTTIDLDTAAIAYGISAKPHGMDEFRGKSIGAPPPPATPTYTITPNVTSVNEGGTVTWTITTTNVANGTTLYWTNSGTTVGADFTDETNGGFVTVNSGTETTIVKTLANDETTEGSQTIIIRLRTGGSLGPIVATSATVTVADTSTTPATPPPPPTYYSFSLGYHLNDRDTACGSSRILYYSLCSSLSSGCILRVSSGGSVVSDGYYSDGSSVYYVEGGVGRIDSETLCSATPPAPPPPPPPPTVTWYSIIVANGSAGAGGTACSRAQRSVGLQTKYINNSVFADATAMANNSDGTGTPTNSSYSDGDIVRTVTNGTIATGDTTCDIV